VEMRDKAGKWLEELAPAVTDRRPVAPAPTDVRAEAEQALVALGYKLPEAARLVSSVQADDVDSSEELIRLALKAAAPKSTR
jgi:Holliday junction DNA helicase RuvA